jgi:uncharacterized protein CbrC (UPF0167 family)
MTIKSNELGIEFPLFEGRLEEASEYVGVITCSLCRRQKNHGFKLDIGCALIIPCHKCANDNGLDVHDREDIECRICHEHIAFPNFEETEIVICYDCLRNGKGAITKDTELGMVSWDQAFDGVTHGLPGLNTLAFELVPKEDDWVGAKVSQKYLFELLRTPTYRTWQGEQWLFCCHAPMTYIGTWEQKDFMDYAPDGDGNMLFEQIIEDNMDGLWEGQLHDSRSIYVFRCQTCKRLRANWDMA